MNVEIQLQRHQAVSFGGRYPRRTPGSSVVTHHAAGKGDNEEENPEVFPLSAPHVRMLFNIRRYLQRDETVN